MLRLSPGLSLSLLLIPLSPAVPAAAPAPIPEAEPVSRARFLMGTVLEAAAHGEPAVAAAALDAALDEVARLEAILSDYRHDSELSRLNRQGAAAPFACSRDLFEFLGASIQWSRATGGAFDITVSPLMTLWDLRGAGRIAAPAEIETTMRRVGWQRLVLDERARTARFSVPGMAVDPGGIGKGYALDAAARVLRQRGVTSALLDFGGQVLAMGAPPGLPAWRVRVAHPLRRDEPVLELDLRDASIGTSGSSQRGVTVAGRRLSHIIDPRTGRPSETQASVSVVAPTGTAADALSKALYLMTPGEGLAWAEARPGLAAIYLEPSADGGVTTRATRNLSGINPARLPRAGDDKGGGNE